MSDREYWWTEGLGGDAREEDAKLLDWLVVSRKVQKKGFCWNLKGISLC